MHANMLHLVVLSSLFLQLYSVACVVGGGGVFCRILLGVGHVLFLAQHVVVVSLSSHTPHIHPHCGGHSSVASFVRSFTGASLDPRGASYTRIPCVATRPHHFTCDCLGGQL